MLYMLWHVVGAVLSNTDKHTKGRFTEESCMFITKIVILTVQCDGAAISSFNDLGNKPLAAYFNINFRLVS